MEITLILNDPPGGRCRLYRAYATALSEHAGARCVEIFSSPLTPTKVRAPAMIINGNQIMPSDGVIIAPADIGTALPVNTDVQRLEMILEEQLEKCMQEWS